MCGGEPNQSGGGRGQLSAQLAGQLLAAAGGGSWHLCWLGDSGQAHLLEKKATTMSGGWTPHLFTLSQTLPIQTGLRTRFSHETASVQACDEYGNKRRQGGEAFKASIRGLDPDAASVSNRSDGSYSLRYCLPSEGAFSLCVTGPDGKHLRGSPATLTAFR